MCALRAASTAQIGRVPPCALGGQDMLSMQRYKRSPGYRFYKPTCKLLVTPHSVVVHQAYWFWSCRARVVRCYIHELHTQPGVEAWKSRFTLAVLGTPFFLP